MCPSEKKNEKRHLFYGFLFCVVQITQKLCWLVKCVLGERRERDIWWVESLKIACL